MKTVVKFLFDNYSNGSKRELYESERSLESDDSIRQAAISVINEAVAHGVTVHGEGVNNKNDSIAIYISSPAVKDAGEGYKESGFGIKYSLGKNGEIKILNGYEPLMYDWTFSELEELVSQGYIKGDATKLIVARPMGLGAAIQEVFDWLGFASSIFTLTSTTSFFFKRLKSTVIDHKIRKIVTLWSKSGIKYPEQLREFIDTKSGWSLGEVKKRLKINEEYAVMLLSSLGLEPKGNSWRITHSKKSISNRKRWIRNEKKYRT